MWLPAVALLAAGVVRVALAEHPAALRAAPAAVVSGPVKPVSFAPEAPAAGNETMLLGHAVPSGDRFVPD